MKFIRKMLVYFVGTVLGKIITFLMVPIYTHVLAPEDYGAADLAYTMAVMLVSIAFMELWTGLLRFSYDEKTEEGKRKLFKHVLLLGAVLTPLYLALAAGIAVWQKLPHMGWMLGCGVLLLALHLWQYMARAMGKSHDFVISGAVSSVTQLAAVLVGLFVLRLDSVMLLAAPALGCVMAILYLEIRFGFLRLAKGKIDRALIRSLVKFSLPLAINAVAYNAMTNLSRFIAKGHLPEEENGYIALSAKFVVIVTSLVYIYSLAWQESAYEESGDADRAAYYGAMNALFIDGMSAMTAAFILLTDMLFPFFIGKEYQPAAAILPLYYVSTLLYAFSTFFGHVYNAEKKNSVLLWSTMAGAAVNIGLLCLLIDRLRATAVPIALIAGYAVNLAVRMILLRRVLPIRLPFGKILICALVTVLCAAAAIWNAGYFVEIPLLLAVTGMYFALNRKKLASLGRMVREKLKSKA
ncbi:MAG: oligosaccharide flippase family protein [Clostridia bacterium]|nr:oligosaccharide flippase family protein [Clostridia bacterium]